MLQRPPQEKPWVSWLFVSIWSLLVFLTIPFARTIGESVSANWGRELFTYAVLTAIAVSLCAAVYYMIRYRPAATGSRLLWMIAVASIFAGYTVQLGKKSPEEAIHFIQYGVLGILAFRALAVRHRDITLYFSAAVIGGIIGTIDEIIQWLTPQRHWDFRDVWINFFAAALIQVAIAMGLKPTYISSRPNIGSVRLFVRLLTVWVVIVGASIFNTPARIAWYAERIPGLGYLKTNESVMSEYGYRYEDPGIGIFRSRLSPDELLKADRNRAVEAAAILDMYRDRDDYKSFLNIYTPVSDPFLHEARVHLFSRDINFFWAAESGQDSDFFARGLTYAYRENQILEKYFHHTLHASAYVWPAETIAAAERHLIQNLAFQSWVSRHLITGFNEAQAALFFVVVLLVLVTLNLYLKKYEVTPG